MVATGTKRGRPRAGERAERETRILAAALDELIERGYDRVTMLGIASRAGASKETLYHWFGSKQGVFGAIIKSNADASALRVQAALEADADPVDTLTAYAVGLLTLLTSPASIALNRAAISAPELADALLADGRYRIGPIVEGYLAQLAERGDIVISDAARAFELLYGLVVRDSQVRVLLGEQPPAIDHIRIQAAEAVDQFFRLTRSEARP